MLESEVCYGPMRISNRKKNDANFLLLENARLVLSASAEKEIFVMHQQVPTTTYMYPPSRTPFAYSTSNGLHIVRVPMNLLDKEYTNFTH